MFFADCCCCKKRPKRKILMVHLSNSGQFGRYVLHVNGKLAGSHQTYGGQMDELGFILEYQHITSIQLTCDKREVPIINYHWTRDFVG